jgi:hypothetical protein
MPLPSYDDQLMNKEVQSYAVPMTSFSPIKAAIQWEPDIVSKIRKILEFFYLCLSIALTE